MATITEQAAGETAAHELLRDLDYLLKRQGLCTEIIEPSTKIKVFAPNGNPLFDETLTMRPNENNVLTWYWSWHSPEVSGVLGPADDIKGAAKVIKNVVCQVRA